MAAPAIPARSLYVIQDDVQALLECADTVAPEQEADYIADLARLLGERRDKTDAVAQFLAHCESQIDFAKAEIARLQERKASFETHLDRLKGYVVRVMDATGTRKLEGNNATLSLRKCPPSVEVLDEGAVPPEYKVATLKMPGDLVDRVLDALDLDSPVSLTWACDKRAIRAALDAGTPVDGASFAADRFTVVRK